MKALYEVPVKMVRVPITLLLSFFVLGLVVACGGGAAEPTSTAALVLPSGTAFLVVQEQEAAGAKPVVVDLSSQNNSGQSGVATLTDQGGSIQVVVDTSVGPAGAGVSQPAHIHTGKCPNLGGIAFPLASIVDGKSTTRVSVNLEDLLAGAFAINLHKSGTEFSVYTSCGELPSKAGASGDAGDSGGYDYAE